MIICFRIRILTLSELTLDFRVCLPRQSARLNSGTIRAIGTKYREDLSEDEKLGGLAKLWMEIKLDFVHFDHVPELNWDSLFIAFIPRVKQTTSTLEYVPDTSGYVRQVERRPYGITPPRELWSALWASPDISTQLIEEKVIVTKVDSDSARQRGIQVGMEVLAIDDMEVKDYARKVRPART